MLRIAKMQMDFGMGLVVRAKPDWNPRQWSNREIRKLAHFFTGNILNVGASKDEDKEGNFYKSYFCNAKTYVKANYSGEDGAADSPDDMFLDLSVPLKVDHGTYDLVFSHTVLEHVHPASVAFDNICSLSRDSVLAVVPFLQCFHGRDGSYGDYNRFSPLLLEELFRDRGLEIVYMNWNEDFPVMNVYITVLATRNPSQFSGKIPACKNAVVGEVGPGIGFSNFLWGIGEKKISWSRRIGEFIGTHIHVQEG